MNTERKINVCYFNANVLNGTTISYGGSSEKSQHIFHRLTERFNGQSLEQLINHPQTVVISIDNISDYVCLAGKQHKYADNIFLLNEANDILISLCPSLFKEASEWHCYTVQNWSAQLQQFDHWIHTYPIEAYAQIKEYGYEWSDVQMLLTPARLLAIKQCNDDIRAAYRLTKKV